MSCISFPIMKRNKMTTLKRRPLSSRVMGDDLPHKKRTFRGKTIAEKMKQYSDEILPAPPSISSCTISSWS